MTAQSGGWRQGLDAVDERLVDGFQSGFRLVERPFDAVGEELGVDGADVRERIGALLEAGVLRRFGPVLNPPVIGASTLGAVKAPEERFDDIAAVVNGYRQVNHNYRRDHAWNMWFVVTAATAERRQAILGEIEDRTGCAVLDLPMLTDFYIDLEFPVVNADRFARESLGETDVAPTALDESGTATLSPVERAVLLAVQDGLPLSATPYADVAAEVGTVGGTAVSATDVIETMQALLDRGAIKRVGCVVDHVATGFDANCMVVWDVPDDALEPRGVAAGRLPYVTLCYHRPRRPAMDWPYNLFTMIHGRDESAVESKIDELAAETLPYDHDRLPSTATLKQTGARYEALVGDGSI